MLTRREAVEYYAAKTGRATANWAFYEVYGLFRLAVIAQQIYFRYQRGETRNPAFRNFWLFVNYLGWRCGRITRAQRRQSAGVTP
jgi:aminoglycoside phosphotransferase (APT) family kinase protein